MPPRTIVTPANLLKRVQAILDVADDKVLLRLEARISLLESDLWIKEQIRKRTEPPAVSAVTA